jgi:hypothetical protein
MAKYQATPQYVEAFQMTAENQASIKSWPDWAIAARNKDSRQIGSIFLSDPENPEGSFSIRTEYDVFEVPIDSWLVSHDPAGTKFMIMQDDHFQAAFIPADDKTETKAVENKAVPAGNPKEAIQKKPEGAIAS